MKRLIQKFLGILKGRRKVSSAPGLDPEAAALERRIGYRFRDPALLRLALLHASSKEFNGNLSNERLEFLGDSVLGLIIVEYLFQRYQNEPEGELTRIKSIVVSKPPLHEIGKAVHLQEALILGRGLRRHALPQSIMANATEALIGAMYLDSGLEPARKFVLSWLVPEIDRLEKEINEQNYKSLLQMVCQRDFGASPIYTVLQTRGPEHKKDFHVQVLVQEKPVASAWGQNKKSAEQEAAFLALKEIQKHS